MELITQEQSFFKDWLLYSDISESYAELGCQPTEVLLVAVLVLLTRRFKINVGDSQYHDLHNIVLINLMFLIQKSVGV
jgi:hypothetical protein